MGRSYQPLDLVQLPTLTAEEAFALTSQLCTQAAEVRVPARVAEPLEDLERERDGMSAALIARRVGAGGDTGAAKNADRQLDRVWGAFHNWLTGWLELEDHPDAALIAALHTFLFSEGLAFLAFRFEKEWAASETRIVALAKEGREELVKDLGGAPFLTALRRAHASYGKALAITAATDAPTEARIREQLDAALAAIRAYVVAVAASVKRGQPSTAARAERLLRPLTEWESTKASAMQGGAPPAPLPETT